ncbi:MAG: hypothetical protein KBT34_04955 [Prevotella sp.]|nr:hypothetical protein [Candidatus Prevotella equi]
MNCTKLQRSLDWCMGKPELPGIMSRVYYTAKSNIVRWPVLPKDSKGNPTSNTYIGEFEFSYDTSFRYITIIGDKSQFTSDAQGEMPSQTQVNKLTAVYPSAGPEATMLAAMLNNVDNVFIFQDMSGRYRVVGSPDYLTKVSVGQDNGQGNTGTVSTTLTIEAPDIVVAPFYEGSIEIMSYMEKEIYLDNRYLGPGNFGDYRAVQNFVSVTPVLAGSAGLPRAEININSGAAINSRDHRYIVLCIIDPMRRDDIRMVDYSFNIHFIGGLPSIGSSHNTYFKNVSLKDGRTLLIYDLKAMSSNEFVQNEEVMFVNYMVFGLYNILAWDGTNPCIPLTMYYVRTFPTLKAISLIYDIPNL